MMPQWLVCVQGLPLGGGFKDFLFSTPPGEMIQFDSYVSNGLKPPTKNRMKNGNCYQNA